MGESLPHKSFAAGETIFEEGQLGSVAYLLDSGQVEITRAVGGERMVLAVLGKGELFGEMSALFGGPRTATARALSWCECRVLGAKLLERQLAESPPLVRRMVHLYAKRLRRTNERLEPGGIENSFTAVARLTDLYYRLHRGLSPQEREATPHWEKGLGYRDLCAAIKELLLITQAELDAIFARFLRLDLIEVANIDRGGGRKAFTERYVRPRQPDTFAAMAEVYYEETRVGDGLRVGESELWDIHALAAAAGCDEELIYRRLALREVPEGLLLFPSRRSGEWIRRMGPEFFRKAPPVRKEGGELASLDDVAWVEVARLGRALESLDWRELAIAWRSACPAARSRMERALPARKTSAMRELAEGLEDVDAAEERRVRDKVFGLLGGGK